MIRVERAQPHEIEIDRGEVLRYLGCGKNCDDPTLIKTADELIDKVSRSMMCIACYDTVPVETGEDAVDFGFMKVESQSLSKNLKNCSAAYVFAATIGFAADRIIQKYSLISPLCAMAAQAAGAAAIEAWCDLLCTRLGEKSRAEHMYMRPRFSPGYGDFALEHQREIFSFLDCTRKAGIKLTDSLLMTPSKSVSAVIGLSKIDSGCAKQGCEVCAKADCVFRRR